MRSIVLHLCTRYRENSRLSVFEFNVARSVCSFWKYVLSLLAWFKIFKIWLLKYRISANSFRTFMYCKQRPNSKKNIFRGKPRAEFEFSLQNNSRPIVHFSMTWKFLPKCNGIKIILKSHFNLCKCYGQLWLRPARSLSGPKKHSGKRLRS